ncbi:hypothetical protein V1502_04135 [Bacillus sp. SCS-153A]|uniref:hypothetical protein n=1 Tax=Rossellomorea sedimentorum TaxID=3115294 RepID=UPI003905E0D7
MGRYLLELFQAFGPALIISGTYFTKQRGRFRNAEMGRRFGARERGYESIRLDAFSGNDRSLKFYERHGYQRLGEVSFLSKPEGHTTYYCYKKKL